MYNLQEVSFRNLGNSKIPTTTHSIFGIYRYPAKFISQIISYVLSNYAHSEMKVIDPFAGSGTVGLVARIYDQSYKLWDLNPMLEILHRVAVLKVSSELDIERTIFQMLNNQSRFLPKWNCSVANMILF